MQVLDEGSDCPAPAEGCAVAIGMFDGVHLGHRLLLDETRRLAAERGASTAVCTFDVHPASVVRPDSAPLLLTDLEQRLELLDQVGVDRALVVRFDLERATEPPEDFVTRVLVDGLATRAVIVGADFHFGYRREGDVALLQRMGKELGFEVAGVPLLASGSDDARAVSSTAIRQALRSGDLAAANRMLGRAHEVRGLVVHGDGLGGSELGFPTANVDVASGTCLPADGIYAGEYIRADGTRHVSAISVGTWPPIDAEADPVLIEAQLVEAHRVEAHRVEAHRVEAHLVNFSGDLDGERARVRFVTRLRGQEHYGSAEALVAQMGRDVEDASAVMA